MGSWDEEYTEREVPDGPPAYTSTVTVPNGKYVRVPLEYRASELLIQNMDDEVDLSMGWTREALESGHAWPLRRGDSHTLGYTLAVREVWFTCPSGGADGAVAVLAAYTRRVIADDEEANPQLTVDNGFPSATTISAANVTTASPGVGT